jgi:hypothetical protein
VCRRHGTPTGCLNTIIHSSKYIVYEGYVLIVFMDPVLLEEIRGREFVLDSNPFL